MTAYKPKRQWVCNKCSAPHMKWEGICRNCGAIATLEEKSLSAAKPKATPSQKSLMSRSKRSERKSASRMTAADGPDPAFAKIATSTGRVGHISNMQFDAVSKNYVTENKNRVLPTWVIKAWVQINQRAVDFSKHALLHIEPPNMPKTFPLNGEHFKLDTMAIIRQDRHEQLILEEKQVERAREILTSEATEPEVLFSLRELFGAQK